MADLVPCPPPADVLPTILAIPGVAVQSTVLASQQGLDGHLGPEEAGAILMLQATFNDTDKATTQQGITNLARLLPVPDATGDLKSLAGGVRTSPSQIRNFAKATGSSNQLAYVQRSTRNPA